LRRIIAFDHISADGYFATADGQLDWVVPDEELTQFNLRTMAEADTILFGRRTYEMFESFWPKAIEDPQGAEDPHAKGRRSDAIQKVGEWINYATKIVFSRTRTAVAWQGSRVIPEFNVAEGEALKHTPGKNMLLLGSGELTRLMARHGLIDEYQFGVVPVILGKGRKLLDVSDHTRCRWRRADGFRVEPITGAIQYRALASARPRHVSGPVLFARHIYTGRVAE
jgi:dihydrofolate reductase